MKKCIYERVQRGIKFTEVVSNMEEKEYRHQERKKRIEHWQVIAVYLVIYDIIAVNFSYILGLLLRFDFSFSKIPVEYIHSFVRFMPIYTVFCLIVFSLLKLYNSL